MNTEHNDTDDIPTDRRPLGFWLKVVDGLISREFATAFEAEGITRREWMLLNAVSGDVDMPGLAERLAAKPKRLRPLADRGWVAERDGAWVITEEGEAAKARLSDVVGGIRSRVAGSVSPEDFATTMTSLEAIARELGWDETQRPWRDGFRGFGRGRGFRRGFGRGEGRPEFGPNMHRGFGPGHGAGPEADDEHGFGHGFAHAHSHGAGHGHEGGACDGPRHGRGHHGHPHHNHRGERRGGERAYERGFDAGFTRGQAAGSTDAA